nr:hypothetical protein [Desulfobulbaceae bacterium]
MEKKEVLFLLIFIAYWAFAFLAKRFSARQKENPQENKGFTLRVLEFIAALKEAGDNELRVDGEGSQWRPAPAYSDEFVPPLVPESQPVESQSARPVGRKVVQKPAAKIKKDPSPTVVMSRKKAAGVKFSKKKLRKAVIWAEIIGTPVGLRDS